MKLKFKNIRASIINHKEQPKHNYQQKNIARNLFGQPHNNQKSFQTIKDSTLSPLKHIDPNLSQLSTNKKNKFCFEDSTQRKNLSPLSNKKRLEQMQKSKGAFIYDSQRKAIKYQRFTSNFGSDQKINQNSSIYFNKQNKQTDSSKGIKLQFRQNQKKLNTARKNTNDPLLKVDSSSNNLYQTSKNSTPGSLKKKNSSSMLFKTALQTSNKKNTLRNNAESDRTSLGRQSSIGKLKQKLFGMKKIISEKQNRPLNKNQSNAKQSTKSFTIYTNTVNQAENKLNQMTYKIQKSKKQNIENDDKTNFQNLVVYSINKGGFNGQYQNLTKLEVSHMSNLAVHIMNESRMDLVNISMAQSCDSILDMSPNL